MVKDRLGRQFAVAQRQDPALVIDDILNHQSFARFTVMPNVRREVRRDDQESDYRDQRDSRSAFKSDYSDADRVFRGINNAAKRIHWIKFPSAASTGCIIETSD